MIFLLEDSENNFVYKLVKNNKLNQTYETNEFLETHYSKIALPITNKRFNKYIEEIYQNPQRMFSDRIKSGEKATFKNETVESIDELDRKKTMLQNGIKGRYIYLEKDSKPNFENK